MLNTITLGVILDSSGVDEDRVVDKCFTVLCQQLSFVLVLEVKAKKKKNKRR